jgi:hypothetical protein
MARVVDPERSGGVWQGLSGGLVQHAARNGVSNWRGQASDALGRAVDRVAGEAAGLAGTCRAVWRGSGQVCQMPRHGSEQVGLSKR